jgi:zinc transport system substrate-binding protein
MPQRVFLMLFLSCCQLAWASPPSVLATVKPMQLIAQAITHGVSDVTTLLPAYVDPHSYALKPSDMRQLNSADLVVWAGPEFETWLAKPLRTLESSRLVVTMGAVHQESHGNAHPWLGSRQAGELAGRIAQQLVKLDPENALQYRRNLAEFLAELEVVDAEIRESLQALPNKSFLVYHDAYGSFEDEYGLQAVDKIRSHEEFKAGAGHLMRLRGMVRDQIVSCVVVPAGPMPAEIAIIAGGYPLRIAVLDPLAGEISVHRFGYIEFLRQLSERIIDCLE